MFTFMCIEQHSARHAVADVRVYVHSAFTKGFPWTTTTPYGDQRPSGAPPG